MVKKNSIGLYPVDKLTLFCLQRYAEFFIKDVRKMKIKIKTGNIGLEGELNDSETAERIYSELPIKGSINRWGDEIYFEIPLHVELSEDAKEVVDMGDLGFWPSGDCFCIFFGKTPASEGDEIRAASAVNIFGKVIGDSGVFRDSKDGDEILIEKS